MYDYGYGYGNETSPVVIILYLLVMAIYIVATWKIYAKAGEPGWAALIPSYNLYVLFKITWGKGSKFWLLLIPIYNIILMIQTYVKLAGVFGKSSGFAAGLIFLAPVFMLILAFGDCRYYAPQDTSAGYTQQGYGYQQPSYPQQPQQGYQQPSYQQPSYPRQPQSVVSTTFCSNCGAKLNADTKFCPSCGSSTNE